MNIGYDAKRYFHNKTGLGNYSRDLVDTIISNHPKDHFFLFDLKPDIENLPSNIVAVPSSSLNLFDRMLWRPYFIRKEIRNYKLDVYHGLSNELPFGKFPEGVKKIVTIHDVIFRHFPEHYPAFDRWIYEKKTAHAVKVSDVIVATSKSTAEDLMSFYGAKSEKIHVVYQTCGAGHRKYYPKDLVDRIKSKYHLPSDYFLYVSSFQTRKNHLQLLKAFKNYTGNCKLVLAGKTGETLKICKDYISDNGLQERVFIRQDVSLDDLPLLYRAAKGFVYPSVTEGFGIPLIEAAFAGLPIAYNDIPVFKELAPEGSIAFDADDIPSFSKALSELSTMDKRDYSDFLSVFQPEIASENTYQLYL